MNDSILSINQTAAFINFVVSRITPVGGVLTSQAALVTQSGASSLQILNDQGVGQTAVPGVSISAPTMAYFAKVGGWIATLAKATGVAVPGVGLVGLGMTAISALAAAASNATSYDIVTDPEFWKKLTEGDLGDYLIDTYGITVQDLLGAMWDAFLTGHMSLQTPSGKTASDFTAAQRWQPRRDPLTLDLDGDGIETVAVSSTNPILFDHDGDGLKNATGWIKPDDGFLVMDRNGNGLIDNGTELFGDSTNLYSGGKAADGFAALAQEDTNSDGKISSADANFAYLRVWRDLNQNGISEANELASLASVNIASIDIAKKNNSQPLPGGNEIADLGTYTKTDGSTGTVGEVMKLADVNLAVDTFHRQFPDTVPLAAGVTALPNMQGSGLVRDLWEAMSQSADLKSLVALFASATTKAAQMAIMDQILGAWADTSTSSSRFKPRARAANARRRQCNPAPRQKPHGMDIRRQSIAKRAISCCTWRGGIGASPIDAIRGGRAAREFGMKSNEVCVLHKQFKGGPFADPKGSVTMLFIAHQLPKGLNIDGVAKIAPRPTLVTEEGRTIDVD